MKAETKYAAGARPWLKFEYVTKVPMCTKLVETSLLSPKEIQFIDSYHADVWASVSSLVSEPARAWLYNATRPLQS